jgi:hypothetical protein
VVHLGLRIAAFFARLLDQVALPLKVVSNATATVFAALFRCQRMREPPLPHIGGMALQAVTMRCPSWPFQAERAQFCRITQHGVSR